MRDSENEHKQYDKFVQAITASPNIRALKSPMMKQRAAGLSQFGASKLGVPKTEVDNSNSPSQNLRQIPFKLSIQATPTSDPEESIKLNPLSV